MTASGTVAPITEQGFGVCAVEHAEPDTRNYNSGCAYKNGRLYLATRRFDVKRHRCVIDINEAVLSTRTGCPFFFAGERVRTLELPSATGLENFEDGRLFWYNDRLHLAYTEGNYLPPFASTSVQKVAELRDDWSVESVATIAFGENTVGHEKNWQFFGLNRRLFFVYSISPHKVVEVDRDWKVTDHWTTPSDLSWEHGTLSGGTPPVLVDRRLISFFHSYKKHPERQRCYSFSAYEFSAEPPFNVTGITEPLIYASEHERTLPNPRVPNWLPLVVFPCGAVWERESRRWTVSAGVNDSDDVLFDIPHHELKFRKII